MSSGSGSDELWLIRPDLDAARLIQGRRGTSPQQKKQRRKERRTAAERREDVDALLGVVMDDDDVVDGQDEVGGEREVENAAGPLRGAFSYTPPPGITVDDHLNLNEVEATSNATLLESALFGPGSALGWQASKT